MCATFRILEEWKHILLSLVSIYTLLSLLSIYTLCTVHHNKISVINFIFFLYKNFNQRKHVTKIVVRQHHFW
jgi:hypothetical protein